MEYFDVMPDPVKNELVKRGVFTDKLLYCVKSDLDAEGNYIDVYLTFTTETLSAISGYEEFGKLKRGEKRPVLMDFKTCGYEEYPLADIKKIYVDRYANAARLMLVPANGEEFPIARFSLGFSDKFEKFSERVNKTITNEPIDDSLLEGKHTHCPICGEPYPDPNRPVCPNCVDRCSTFRRLLKLFGEFKGSVALILLTILLSNVMAVLTPVFGTKMLYDDILKEDGKHYGQLGLMVGIVLSIDILSLIMRVVSGVITSRTVPKVAHRLRIRIFSSMEKLSLDFFTGKQTGSLMSRVDRDSMNIYWFFTDIVPFGLTNVVKLLGITVIMLTLSPVLSIGLILAILFIIIVQSKFYRSQRKLYRKFDVATRSANSVLSDAMNGQRVVKAFANESLEAERYSKKNSAAFMINSNINSRIAGTIPLIWTFYRIFSKLFFYIGAVMVIRGHLLLGSLTALVSYTELAYEPINFFTWIGDRWARCMDAASRMFEITDALPSVKEADDPVRMEKMRGDIELKNVTFEYEAGHPIIKDISLKVESGKMYGIVGKTGAGKSTIINLMARLYDVTGGEILIDGVNVRDIAFEDLRRCIGIVSQETYLFMGSIADNIRYSDPNVPMEEVISAAKAANAHDFIMKLPDGYDTKVGEGGVSLSGGEKQRISIARAIIQRPDILILDEATASMDTRTERRIQAAIDNLKAGRTIISIAHRLSTLRDADMLCVIENGELKEKGTHDELIAKKGKYFELYKMQFEALGFINN
ncbi:ABC transporter ATP-binding protein [uncultured Ruminococcus sp.]|uniref:ABC transporter ATP-binding protein n=1 Tax=uncultured Ruminococcus sp. TaxID=165186 RepID=UPI0025D71AEE|nr:ABC transporter ATP-binding protein [uncultured Ruminococcus sp.]